MVDGFFVDLGNVGNLIKLNILEGGIVDEENPVFGAKGVRVPVIIAVVKEPIVLKKLLKSVRGKDLVDPNEEKDVRIGTYRVVPGCISETSSIEENLVIEIKIKEL